MVSRVMRYGLDIRTAREPAREKARVPRTVGAGGRHRWVEMRASAVRAIETQVQGV